MTDLELLNGFSRLENGLQLDGIIMIQWGMQPKCLKNLS
jgi:hypothetical protein